MDIYTRFNRKKIADRQIDTLIGLSKGLTADGRVDQAEAEFLHNWLVQALQADDHPIIGNLLIKVESFLEDGVLDDDEASELLCTLRTITGDETALGEIGKSSTLPLDDPAPRLQFRGQSFLFTGTCAYGTRKDCHAVIRGLGGIVKNTVSRKLDYLVIGSYVTDSWAHETFGRKIEKAMAYRDQGVPIRIVAEEHWANEAGL